MRRNPEYYRQGLPYADSYTKVVIGDVQTAQAAFRTGQVLHVATNGQITRLLKQSVPDMEVLDSKLLGVGGGDRIWMSPITGPTKDQRVRQALGKLIDREQIIQNIYFGSGWMNMGIFVPSFDWHLPGAEVKRLLARNVQGARQLLQAAGVDLGSWRPVFEAGLAGSNNSPTAEYFVSVLRELGVQTSVKVVDRVEITDKIFGRGETEICLCNNAPTPSTNGQLYTFFHSTDRNGVLFKQLGDKSFDDLIDKQAAMVGDAQGRKAAMQELMRKNLELAVAVPVVTSNGEVAISSRWRGLKNHTSEPHRFTESWLRS